jgi:hypothetical protein
VVEEQHFAVVPEWVIDAELSDAAFRLYSLLLRYGNGSGSRMPSRRLLARRLHRSTDSIDRAMRELVDAGIVRVEHRRRGRLNLTNCYHLRTTDPSTPARGGRSSAATASDAPGVDEGRGSGRTDAATRTRGRYVPPSGVVPGLARRVDRDGEGHRATVSETGLGNSRKDSSHDGHESVCLARGA